MIETADGDTFAIQVDITAEETTRVDPSPPMPSDENSARIINNKPVDNETQSLTWSELTVEMLSEIVSQQVIQVSQIEVPLMTSLLTNRHDSGCCYHMKGIRWKDLLDMIISSHNGACQHTRVVFSHSTIQVGVVLEAGATSEQDIRPVYKACEKVHAGVQTERVVLDVQTGKTVWMDEQVKVTHAETQTVTNDFDDATACNGGSKLEPDTSSGHASDVNSAEKELEETVIDNDPSGNVKNEEPEFEIDVPVKGFPAQCPECKKRFRSRTLLKRHSVVHEENYSRHPCPHCDKVCKNAWLLQRHVAAHFKPPKRPRRGRPVKVKDAPKKMDEPAFKRASKQLKVKTEEVKVKDAPKKTDEPAKRASKQPKVKTEEVPLQCTVCQKTFTIARNLTRHMAVHSREDETCQCPHCDKVFQSNRYLQLHIKVHAEQKPFKCDDCDASFGGITKLKKHRGKEHNIHEQHICPICGMIYKHRKTLDDHMLDHDSTSSFLCSQCGKSFNRPSTYRLHQAYHASKANPGTHPCEHCSKSYDTRSLLNKHVRSTHQKERNHKCGICDTGFFSRQQRNTHMRTHVETHEHQCTICGKFFAQKYTLEAHRHMHMGYRPFVCRHCGKGFTYKPHLIKHETIHAETREPRKRPFKCNVCDAAFLSRIACRDHEKRHAGIKNHKCEVCSVAFVTRGDLVRHMRRHTKGKPFKCQNCDMSFSKKLELTEHEASHDVVQVPITVTLVPN